MKHALCWITDYFVPECWLRACVHSTSPALACQTQEDLIEEDPDDVS